MISPLLIVAATALSYPESRTQDLVETLHGTEVSDPYRWLEDDRSDETEAWVKAQNRVTETYLGTLPGRDEIHDRLADLLDCERYGSPRRYGERWFHTYNSGLQNQSVLRVADSPDGEPRLLLDPNRLSDDGTVSLADWQPSEDGELLAYAVSRGGSDWNEIRVRRVDTGEDLDDHLRWVKFSGLSWLPDNSGFLYSRFPATDSEDALTERNENHQVWLHRIGTEQSEDTLVYHRPEHPRWTFGAGVTEDGNYLVLHARDGETTHNRSYYRSLDADDFIPLLDQADAFYGFIGNVGPVFYYRTNLDAPRYRVIAVDTRNPARDHWREVIPERDDVLQWVSMVGGHLVCGYLEDARSEVRMHDIDGSLVRNIELPGIGSAGGFRGRWEDDHTYFGFSSFTEPGAIHRLEISSGKSELWRRPRFDFDGSRYESRQVFVESKDGTRVPLFVVHRKGLKLDGSHRTLLYGYGGFNISQKPGFSASRAVWLERGGVFALACIRGGGEYGKEWHDAGIKLNKQNSFDDFMACAGWLVDNHYTSRSRLAIQGGSNGGLLVGACMTQHPEFFGACLPAVGVMDMLRFHKFTIGWAWERDYGSPEDPEHFANLLGYSPYHNLKPGTRYPATLVTTADHDDRVVPAHSFKFAARLQACQADDGPPVLIRIDTSAGHGAGTALEKVIDRVADQWAFLEANLEE